MHGDVIQAFSNGGATGLAMLAMLLVIFLQSRSIVTTNRQLTDMFERMADASKADAESTRMLAVAIARVEAKLEVMMPTSRSQ